MKKDNKAYLKRRASKLQRRRVNSEHRRRNFHQRSRTAAAFRQAEKNQSLGNLMPVDIQISSQASR